MTSLLHCHLTPSVGYDHYRWGDREEVTAQSIEGLMHNGLRRDSEAQSHQTGNLRPAWWHWSRLWITDPENEEVFKEGDGSMPEGDKMKNHRGDKATNGKKEEYHLTYSFAK